MIKRKKFFFALRRTFFKGNKKNHECRKMGVNTEANKKSTIITKLKRYSRYSMCATDSETYINRHMHKCK